MKFAQKMKKFYLNEMMFPTWVSIFLNPFYLNRKALVREIKNNKNYVYGKVLDFGCGNKTFKKCFDYEEYIGVDIEESGHSHKNEQIDIYYDGKKIPFSDNYFDSIFTSEVLEHVFNIDEILNELNRVLKCKGNIVLSIPFSWDEHEQPYDCARYTTFGIKYLLEKHGFKIVKIQKTNNHIEVIIVNINLYIYYLLLPIRSNIIKIILTSILVTPFNLIGLILSKLMPSKKTIFNNIVVVGEKI